MTGPHRRTKVGASKNRDGWKNGQKRRGIESVVGPSIRRRGKKRWSALELECPERVRSQTKKTTKKKEEKKKQTKKKNPTRGGQDLHSKYRRQRHREHLRAEKEWVKTYYNITNQPEQGPWEKNKTVRKEVGKNFSGGKTHGHANVEP